MFNMISPFATLALSLIATSAVSALYVPRATAPKGWDTVALEVRLSIPCDYGFCLDVASQSYDTYHCRYLALQCQNQHNTQFFSDCCHPLAVRNSLHVLD
jgi:hypothetical protein